MNINRPDENYMKIVATELFAQKHNISTLEAFHFLDKYNLYSDISEHYNALHTQPLDEVYYFVEDIVATDQLSFHTSKAIKCLTLNKKHVLK